MIVAPVTLEGRHVRLEPLSQAHHADLAALGLDEQLWRWIPVPVRTPDEMFGYIDTALESRRAVFPCPSRSSKTQQPRDGNIDRTDHRVEIGWTWVAPAWPRTAANAEAKYLLLRHAFENARLQTRGIKPIP